MSLLLARTHEKKERLHFWSLAAKAWVTNEGKGPSPHYTSPLFATGDYIMCPCIFCQL